MVEEARRVSLGECGIYCVYKTGHVTDLTEG